MVTLPVEAYKDTWGFSRKLTWNVFAKDCDQRAKYTFYVCLFFGEESIESFEFVLCVKLRHCCPK